MKKNKNTRQTLASHCCCLSPLHGFLVSTVAGARSQFRSYLSPLAYGGTPPGYSVDKCATQLRFLLAAGAFTFPANTQGTYIYICMMEQKLKKYLEEADKAIKKLSEEKAVQISHLDFQIALGAKLGYDQNDSHYVASNDLTSEQMYELLKTNTFEKPIVLAEIIFFESIIPDGIPISLNEQEIKSKGEIWVIHKYDADPFPSNPHAHNKLTGYKVHLGTGELFDYKNKPLNASISKKDLIALREKVKNVTLPTLNI